MGPLQTKQLEKQHVQWWRGGSLPKIPQPVDLSPFTFCIFISLWSAAPWHNTPFPMSLTSWNMMSWLPLLNRFSRESNQMSKRFSKIKFCSLLIGWLSLYQLSESPRGKKVSAQSVDALWSLPLKYCHVQYVCLRLFSELSGCKTHFLLWIQTVCDKHKFDYLINSTRHDISIWPVFTSDFSPDSFSSLMLTHHLAQTPWQLNPWRKTTTKRLYVLWFLKVSLSAHCCRCSCSSWHLSVYDLFKELHYNRNLPRCVSLCCFNAAFQRYDFNFHFNVFLHLCVGGRLNDFSCQCFSYFKSLRCIFNLSWH